MQSSRTTEPESSTGTADALRAPKASAHLARVVLGCNTSPAVFFQRVAMTSVVDLGPEEVGHSREYEFVKWELVGLRTHIDVARSCYLAHRTASGPIFIPERYVGADQVNHLARLNTRLLVCRRLELRLCLQSRRYCMFARVLTLRLKLLSTQMCTCA